MWNQLEPNVEQVRASWRSRSDATWRSWRSRNASEGLQIVQLGIDLQPGDHVVTTNQDYGRMLDTWDARATRQDRGHEDHTFPVPTLNLSDLTDRITRDHAKTKVIHICHITNLTGQLFPVREIARISAGARHQTIVDGAHALAHFRSR
jgi:selenocysteine lyase/cysteine desulfurase